MHKIKSCRLAFILLPCFATQLALADTAPEQIDPGVYNVWSCHADGMCSAGTGFAINEQGYIATNNHVVTPPGELTVKQKRNGIVLSYPATIVWKSGAYDLAILRAEGVQTSPLMLNADPPRKTQEIVAVGFPGASKEFDDTLDDHFETTWTKGMISRTVTASWMKGGPSFTIVQHTAFINKGNSGGPLLNDCGQVVGVNTMKVNDMVSQTEEGIAVISQDGTYFASHIGTLAPILDELHISYQKSSGCGGLSAPDQYQANQPPSSYPGMQIDEGGWDADFTPSAQGIGPETSTTSRSQDDWSNW